MYRTRTRTTRLRLTTSVAAVLAATLGAGTLAAPAATAADAPAPAPREGVLTVPHHADAIGAGAAGFFVENAYSSEEEAWVRYSDGARTALTGIWQDTVFGDTVLRCTLPDATVQNVATGATVLTVPVQTGETCGGFTGTAVFLTSWGSAQKLRMYTAEHGSRPVTGIPAGSTYMRVTPGTATHALLSYTAPDGVEHRGTIDLATASVAVDHAAPLATRSGLALSATHLAWNEYDPATRTAQVVARALADGTKKTFPAARNSLVAFLGDRLVHSYPDGSRALAPSPLLALNIVDLKTGGTTRLLDHVRAITPAPDGGLLVSGGEIGTGDGVFHVSAGADGTPTARLTAVGDYPAELAEVSAPALPSGTIDLDWEWAHVPFTQYFNHQGVKYSWTITHTRTGKTHKKEQLFEDGGADGRFPHGIPMGYQWNADLNSGNATDPKGSLAAYNGAYTWESTAVSGGGFGAPIKRSGSFTLKRAPRQHDFDDNGSSDLLARDASGVLRTHDAGAVGGGWQIYDRIEATGNIAGTTHADLVARDKAGVLWLYQGNGRGGFLGRVKVGGGWQTYEHIAGGSDFTGDGRPDLVAADRTGALYLYRATGNVDAPFAARKKVGGGWQVYNQLVGTGNIAGAAHGDLLARDKDGVLWMYLGKGDGTFTARTKVGSGFGRYGELVGAGRFDRDGSNDLLAHEPSTGKTYYFRGLRKREAPFDLTRIPTGQFTGGSYNLFS
ncbi:VCBS repeat-containing protein [Streptomyces sp. NPDC047974]|uniref:FG-GAP repeat domain-containing protein n=1 Tax=Streptomyces sp. NPDC047974 TaxID=3154343 RepID=UPI0033E30892